MCCCAFWRYIPAPGNFWSPGYQWRHRWGSETSCCTGWFMILQQFSETWSRIQPTWSCTWQWYSEVNELEVNWFVWRQLNGQCNIIFALPNLPTITWWAYPYYIDSVHHVCSLHSWDSTVKAAASFYFCCMWILVTNLETQKVHTSEFGCILKELFFFWIQIGHFL